MAGRPPSGIGIMIRDVFSEAGSLNVYEVAKRVNEVRTGIGLRRITAESVKRYVFEARELGLLEFVGKEAKPVEEQIEGHDILNFRRFYSIVPGSERAAEWTTLARSTASKT